MSAAAPPGPRPRPRDRRADDERRALVQHMLHGLYTQLAAALGERLAEGAVGHDAPPAAAVADALIDAGLPVERGLLDRLGRRADLHRMAVRLRALQAEASEHSVDIVPVDPLERLAGLPGRSPAADAARAYLAAEARAADAFGDPLVPPVDLDDADREMLAWSVAGAFAALGGARDPARIAAAVDQVTTADGLGPGPTTAALALMRDLPGAPGLLLDIVAHGHLGLGIALLARGAGLRWRAAAAIITDGGPAVAALLALGLAERESAAALLLALARGLHPNEDRAAAVAIDWLERYGQLADRPDEARAMLLPAAFAAARERVARTGRR